MKSLHCYGPGEIKKYRFRELGNAGKTFWPWTVCFAAMGNREALAAGPAFGILKTYTWPTEIDGSTETEWTNRLWARDCRYFGKVVGFWDKRVSTLGEDAGVRALSEQRNIRKRVDMFWGFGDAGELQSSQWENWNFEHGQRKGKKVTGEKNDASP